MPHIADELIDILRAHGLPLHRAISLAHELGKKGLLAETAYSEEAKHEPCDCVPDLGPVHCHACSDLTMKEEPYPGPHCPEETHD